MKFNMGDIEGVIVHKLMKYVDERGFLVETFRRDILPEGTEPQMSYVSYTEPGMSRGPHEHREQTDIFAFIGPGNIKIQLWDNSLTWIARFLGLEISLKLILWEHSIFLRLPGSYRVVRRAVIFIMSAPMRSTGHWRGQVIFLRIHPTTRTARMQLQKLHLIILSMHTATPTDYPSQSLTVQTTMAPISFQKSLFP